jgi:hypothetical protein
MQAGNYSGTLVKGIVSEAQNGTPQAAIVFKLTHVAVDGDWQALGDSEAERTVYLSMSGGAKEYTKKKLTSLGYQAVETVEGEPRIRFDAAVVAEPVELTCRHETYNGRDVERWDLANWGGGGPKAASDAATMQFTALMDD